MRAVSSTPQTENRPLHGILWMLGSGLCFVGVTGIALSGQGPASGAVSVHPVWLGRGVSYTGLLGLAQRPASGGGAAVCGAGHGACLCGGVLDLRDGAAAAWPCIQALQPSIPHLTRSALHRCLQRNGISRLPDVEGDKPKWQKFKRYPIGFFCTESAEVQPAEGMMFLFVGINSPSKFGVTQLVVRRTGRQLGGSCSTCARGCPIRSTPFAWTTVFSSLSSPGTGTPFLPGPCALAWSAKPTVLSNA
jgi:hypothetical protein